MDVLHERCAGLDVHKKEIVACFLTSKGSIIKKFSTLTEDLLKMTDWLTENGCTHVAMESTGVYWKPVYNLLEDSDIKVTLANAQHIKAVPGRKTDINDAEWIAKLLRHGLINNSFVPDRPQRELRELTRYRRSLIQEKNREANRIQKVLEGANIKLSSVASDVLGKSGRTIIKSLIKGIEDTEVLADLAIGQLRKKKDNLKKALKGLLGEHQRFMLREQLNHVEELEHRIERLDAEIEERMRPFELKLQLLDQIPGVNKRLAEDIVAETGIDMSRFPTDKHIASWTGVCPGNNESAGKRKNGRSRPGNRNLCSALVLAARAAVNTKGTYLSALYHQLAARRGNKRAVFAIAHKIVVILYHMLKTGEVYNEKGMDFLDRVNEKVILRKTTRKLESLGYRVLVEKIAS